MLAIHKYLWNSAAAYQFQKNILNLISIICKRSRKNLFQKQFFWYVDIATSGSSKQEGIERVEIAASVGNNNE